MKSCLHSSDFQFVMGGVGLENWVNNRSWGGVTGFEGGWLGGRDSKSNISRFLRFPEVGISEDEGIKAVKNWSTIQLHQISEDWVLKVLATTTKKCCSCSLPIPILNLAKMCPANYCV